MCGERVHKNGELEQMQISAMAEVLECRTYLSSIQVRQSVDSSAGSAEPVIVDGLLHTTATLSQARSRMATTVAGSLAIFAGGDVTDGLTNGMTDAVDIYSARRHRWSTAKLSQPRAGAAAATVSNVAIFAGGYNRATGISDVVDMFDSNTGRWSSARLPQPSQFGAVAVVDNKAIFAGGDTDSSVVDIYDGGTGHWSSASLSRGRNYIAAAVVGDLAIFAGGYIVAGGGAGGAFFLGTDNVDIYNARTDHWSTAKLSQARGGIAVTVVGNKAIFAGGDQGSSTSVDGRISDAVDIYNVDTGRWSTAKLSEARVGIASAAVDGLALFAGGRNSARLSNVVDIFESDTNNWSVVGLGQPTTAIAAATIGRRSIFAGGAISDADGTDSDAIEVFDSVRGRFFSGRLSQPRQVITAVTDGSTAIFAGGARGLDGSENSAVDLFTPETMPPTVTFVSEALLTKQRKVFVISINYHDAGKIDVNTLDGNDIIVTGPNGFSSHAQLVSQGRRAHGSTRFAVYSVQAPGRRWDNSDNGTYILHFQAGQVTDIAGNAATSDRLGTFTIAIPAQQLAGGLATKESTAMARNKRTKNEVLT